MRADGIDVARLAPGAVITRGNTGTTGQWLDARVWLPLDNTPVVVRTASGVDIAGYEAGIGWGDELDGYIADVEWWSHLPTAHGRTER